MAATLLTRLGTRAPKANKARPGGLFLVRTLPKVKGEMALAVLSYNLKRTLNILGIEQLIEKLKMQMVFNSV